VLALQSRVSRTLDPVAEGAAPVTDFSVHATLNVVRDSVVLRGDTRAFTP
jgi:metal-dependent amidase/aminoacylase/carboxypeptidase family protein